MSTSHLDFSCKVYLSFSGLISEMPDVVSFVNDLASLHLCN